MDPVTSRQRKLDYKKKWYKKRKELEPDYEIKRLYGINQETWQVMFDNQKGCCKICGRHQTELKQVLHVDHDHSSGKVRSLLCRSCNFNVGVYENWHEKIKEYLKCL
jgi:hypothetical protein